MVSVVHLLLTYTTRTLDVTMLIACLESCLFVKTFRIKLAVLAFACRNPESKKIN